MSHFLPWDLLYLFVPLGFPVCWSRRNHFRSPPLPRSHHVSIPSRLKKPRVAQPTPWNFRLCPRTEIVPLWLWIRSGEGTRPPKKHPHLVRPHLANQRILHILHPPRERQDRNAPHNDARPRAIFPARAKSPTRLDPAMSLVPPRLQWILSL